MPHSAHDDASSVGDANIPESLDGTGLPHYSISVRNSLAGRDSSVPRLQILAEHLVDDGTVDRKSSPPSRPLDPGQTAQLSWSVNTSVFNGKDNYYDGWLCYRIDGVPGAQSFGVRLHIPTEKPSGGPAPTYQTIMGSEHHVTVNELWSKHLRPRDPYTFSDKLGASVTVTTSRSSQQTLYIHVDVKDLPN